MSQNEPARLSNDELNSLAGDALPEACLPIVKAISGTEHGDDAIEVARRILSSLAFNLTRHYSKDNATPEDYYNSLTSFAEHIQVVAEKVKAGELIISELDPKTMH